ncbi:MerR family transcriptional regulator [Bacillus thuringiensis]|uniref:MerR family transcriptional regulator n=1 Tax=Bacillus thuringiensis TaxID=1428 RepID=UPI0016435DEF|nr:MerR family transcriptional regulator [Bacillus thuringiensis]
MDNVTTQEKAYWASEVAEKLQMNTSTLRNWTNALEKENYQFIKDEKGRRAFLDKDITNLKVLQKCLKNNMTMKDAVRTVISTLEGEIRTGIVREEERPLLRPLSADMVETIVNAALEKQKREFEDTLGQQNKTFEEMLNKKLTKQAEFILSKMNQGIEKRDRELMSTMRNIQEEKETHRALEITTIQEKKPWWRFW